MNVTEEQVFEHERFLPIAGWSSRHLLPTERSRYSQCEDGSNSTAQFPQIRLQEGGFPPGTPSTDCGCSSSGQTCISVQWSRMKSLACCRS